MTKMKSKKMTKSTFAIIIMAIAMVAMLAFGGTYAYFTAQATAKSETFTTGYVTLTSTAAFSTTKTNIVPGAKITTAGISVTPDQAGTGSYIAVKFVVTLNDDDATESEALNLSGTDSVLSGDWTHIGGGVYIYGTGTSQAPVFTEATTNAAIPFTTDAIEFNIDDRSTDNAKGDYMSATLKIEVRAASIQSSDGTATGKIAAADALRELQAILGDVNYPGVTPAQPGSGT